MIQAIVSAIFVDRLYGDVTIAKTTDIAREINFILTAPIDTDLRALQARAQPLAITVRPSVIEAVAQDRHDFFDISGRYIISTLHAEIDGISAIDLSNDNRAVQIWLTQGDANLYLSFSRRRASAVNPDAVADWAAFAAAYCDFVWRQPWFTYASYAYETVH